MNSWVGHRPDMNLMINSIPAFIGESIRSLALVQLWERKMASVRAALSLRQCANGIYVDWSEQAAVAKDPA